MGFNPFTTVKTNVNAWFDRTFPQNQDEDEGDLDQTTAPVPSAPPAPTPSTTVPVPASPSTPQAEAGETTIVTGQFVPDNGHRQAVQLYTESQKATERLRREVEKFDEDRQEPVEWVIRKLASLFCYIVPFVAAVPVGLAIGDAFAQPHVVPGQPVTVVTPEAAFAIRLLSVFLEILMPILGLATTIALKRAAKDRSQVPGFIVIAAFFVLLSLANGIALLFLLERGVPLSDPVAMIGVIGRSFGTFILDLGCTIYLSVSGVRSLQKYLADKRQKIVALRDANQVHIEMEQTQIHAAINRQTAVMDMQSKQQRAQTWNEIEKMQSQSMIDNARKSMQGNGGSSYYRRGY